MIRTNINAIDARLRGFNVRAHEQVKAAVVRSQGEVILAMHLGWFEKAFLDQQDVGHYELGYTIEKPAYDQYVSEVADHLASTPLPIIIMGNQFVPLPKQITQALSGQKTIVEVDCVYPIDSKPVMDYAKWIPWRTHWSSLRQVFYKLGIVELEFIGEQFIDRAGSLELPEEELPSLLGQLFGRSHNELYCVDDAAIHLVGISGGRLAGRVNYPFTFPGLINVETKQRLTLSGYRAIEAEIRDWSLD
ncbi:hypothetical protein ACFL31_04440 [Candidatus Margulisiibacteriota bacterium]